MNTTIYYFSATGNSLRTAKVIAGMLAADLSSMPIHKGVTCQSEVIGFVFPTYYWGVPRTVTEFIRQLQIEAPQPYIFAVTTYGALPGGVLGHFEDLLKSRGLHMDYGMRIESVANFIEEYNPRVGSSKEKLEKADERARQAARDILAKKKNGPHRYSIWDNLFYRIYTNMKLNRDHGFHIDQTCTHCGLCQTICPNQNIVAEGNSLKFRHQCEHCVACIHNCPNHAIQWKNVTRKRVRYRNPEISVKEIVAGMQKK